jgi:hypothetical protein
MADDLIKLVNSSGFPLQIAIAHQIEKAKGDWRVLFKEHAWRNENDGQFGFIDLVLAKGSISGARVMVVECKRSRNASWIFLVPNRNNIARYNCKCWSSYYHLRKRLFFGWTDIPFDPDSPEAEFCVVRGQDDKSRPMLERIADMLVSSTEALAAELDLRYKTPFSPATLFFNVIITTAKLHTCAFDPSGISLLDGEIPREAEMNNVSFVRFRKQLSAQPPKDRELKVESEHEISRAKENTVIVVNADKFLEFINQFEVDNDAFIKHFNSVNEAHGVKQFEP